MFDIALESMQAQVQSKFGSELDKLWQKVIDWRDHELKETNYRLRFRALKEYFEKNVAQKFMDLVWKYCGLYVEKCDYAELWESGFACQVFIVGDKNKYGSNEIGNILNGDYFQRYFGIEIPESMTADQLVQLATSYDKMTGAIKSDKKMEIRKIVSTRIYFDLRTGFLMEDMLPKNSGVTNCTARELTSVLLHEIGHTLNLVDHAADMYAHSASFKYLAGAYSAQINGNPEAAIRLAKRVAAEAETRGSADVGKKLRTAATRLETDMLQASTNADPFIKRKLCRGLEDVCFTVLLDIAVGVFNIAGIGGQKRLTMKDHKEKYGDLPCNSRLLNWEERKADEYAFSHGYGADNMAFLERLSKYCARVCRSPEEVEKINAAEHLKKGLTLLAKLKLLIYAPTYCWSYGYDLYPHGAQRCKEMLSLAVRELKLNGADPVAVEKYMRDVDRLINMIDNYDQADEFTARAVKGYELFMKYVSIKSFFDSLIHGKVLYELETLIDDIQKLSGNLIHYYGFKIQTLAQKGK